MADKELNVSDLPGYKEAQLEKLGACVICGKKALDPGAGSLSFYVVRVTHAMFDVNAIYQRAGMTAMMGGGQAGDAIARVMGPDKDFAKIFNEPVDVFVHEQCARRINHLLDLIPGDKK